MMGRAERVDRRVAEPPMISGLLVLVAGIRQQEALAEREGGNQETSVRRSARGRDLVQFVFRTRPRKLCFSRSRIHSFPCPTSRVVPRQRSTHAVAWRWVRLLRQRLSAHLIG